MLGSDIIKPRYVFGQEHLHTGHLSGGGCIAFQNASARMRRADRPDLEHAFACSLIVGVERFACDMLVGTFMRHRPREGLSAWPPLLLWRRGTGRGGHFLMCAPG